MAGRRDDADEAYGRVAIRALERCPVSFRDPEHARAWLLALTRNVCMDIHRERRREREVSIEEKPHEEPVGADDPESSYLLGERNRHLRSLIRRLPPRLRRTVELHVYCDMTYEEVARELGISVVSVRKRMQEVRRCMREGIGRRAKPLCPAEEPPETETPPPVLSLVTPLVTTENLDECDAELLLPADPAWSEVRIEAIERYCAKHPRGWRGRLALARALTAEGRVIEAARHYQYVAERQPFPIEHWLELGVALEAAGSRIEAIAAYEAGARHAGRKGARQQLGARAAALRGDLDGARELVTCAPESDAPRDGSHARELGEICLRNGRPAEAVRALRAAIGRGVKDPLLPSLLYDALAGSGLTIAARNAVEDAAVLDPSNVPLLERLLVDRARGGQFDDALAATLLRLAPERARTQAALARLSIARGEHALAEARLLLFQERHPRHAGAWLALGELFLHLGRIRKALESALTAMAIDPESRVVWRLLCRVVPYAGDPDEAQRLVCEVMRRFGGDAMLLGEAAVMALAAENRSLALELCGRAVELQPEIASLRRRYGEVLADAGAYDTALEELADGAGAIPPEDGHEEAARIALLLASVHRRLGSRDSSETWGRMAAARADACRGTDVAASFALRAAAEELLGEEAAARASYRRAIGAGLLHPERARTAMALRRLEGGLS
jgi:RNA polymerase sigma factor (sigma-70 family)